MRIDLKRIELFNGNANATTTFRGGSSYTIPAREPGAVVTFVVHTDGREHEFNEVLIGQFNTLDDLHQVARESLKDELKALGKIADQIPDHEPLR